MPRNKVPFVMCKHDLWRKTCDYWLDCKESSWNILPAIHNVLSGKSQSQSRPSKSSEKGASLIGCDLISEVSSAQDFASARTNLSFSRPCFSHPHVLDTILFSWSVNDWHQWSFLDSRDHHSWEFNFIKQRLYMYCQSKSWANISSPVSVREIAQNMRLCVPELSQKRLIEVLLNTIRVFKINFITWPFNRCHAFFLRSNN